MMRDNAKMLILETIRIVSMILEEGKIQQTKKSQLQNMNASVLTFEYISSAAESGIGK